MSNRGLNENENEKFHYDGVTSVRVVGKELSPTDSSKLNPSYVLTRNGSGYITSIAMAVGIITYTKTITRDGSNYITNISVWS